MITAVFTDTSKALSKRAADKLAELGKLSGAVFDKAYIANEVAYHKAVNSALETQLIPSTSNATWNWPPYAEGPRTTCGYVWVNPYSYRHRGQGRWVYECR
jgi:hypothetical protein